MRSPYLLSLLVAGGCSASDGSQLANDPEGSSGGSGGMGFTSGASSGGGGACAAETLEAELVKEPVDVILYVDTSYSMGPGIDQVEAKLNSSLAAILDQGGLDYRLVVLGAYETSTSYDGPKICIDQPLGGAPCLPSAPAIPALTSTFFHYSVLLGSGGLPGWVLTGYDTVDEFGVAPSGYSAWLRPEALKVFVVISDAASTPNDPSLGDALDAQLLAMSPPMFGTPSSRHYILHTIVGLQANAPATAPYLPADPIVSGTCDGFGGGVGAGEPLQQMSILSGGWRFPVCEFDNYDVVFEQIAAGAVEQATIACEIPFPDASGGQTIDPNTVQVEHTTSTGSEVFTQVAGLADCQAGSFYIEDEVIYLCPETCSNVRGSGGSVEIVFGCDVGFAK